MKLESRILICVEKFTNKRDIERFGINVLNKYYRVDILNFNNLINNRKSVASKYEKKINSLNNFNSFIYKKNYLCAIDYLRSSSFSSVYDIKKIIKSKNIKLVQIHNGLLPVRKFNIYKKLYKIFNLKKMYLYVYENIFKFLCYKNIKYDLTLISGLLAEKIYPETKSIKKKIFTHSFDYESVFYGKKNLIKKETKNSIAFIDENLILHPDYKIFNIDLAYLKRDYYLKLRNTLLEFEKTYKAKVTICAHPSSEIIYFKKYLGGFKVVSGKTEQIVKKSKLVIIHQSTAISFPVIFNKPIVFLNYKGISHSFLYENISNLAKFFKKKYYLIDEKNKIFHHQDFKVDKKVYKKYLNNYIVHPKANKKSMWLELIKEIKKQ